MSCKVISKVRGFTDDETAFFIGDRSDIMTCHPKMEIGPMAPLQDCSGAGCQSLTHFKLIAKRH